MSRQNLFGEEQWLTYKVTTGGPARISLASSTETARSVLKEYFGPAVDAAFVSQDKRQIFAYVAELTEPVLERIAAAEEELAKRLPDHPALRVVAHQGRAYPSDRPGMDRII